MLNFLQPNEKTVHCAGKNGFREIVQKESVLARH